MLIGSLFEQLACCFHLFMFFLLEKLLFFQLNIFSTDPQQILFLSSLLSLFTINPRLILNPSKFLGFISIESRQLLRSMKKNSCALYLLDRFSTNCSIHQGDFCRQQILNSTSTDLFLLRFSARQILDKIFNPSSCILYLKLRRDSDFILLISLSIENLLSGPKPLSLTQITPPTQVSAQIKLKSRGKHPKSLLFPAFMHFQTQVLGF